jgi:hypothetical protein
MAPPVPAVNSPCVATVAPLTWMPTSVSVPVGTEISIWHVEL